MYGLLLAILVLDGVFLTVVILLQAGKGGGLAAMGGGAAATEGILGGRQATTMLTRATWTGGGMFMALALVLSIMSSKARAPESILQFEVPTQAPQPVMDALQAPSGGDPGGEAGGAGGDAGSGGGNL